jgi:hypothetical protein
VGDAATLLKREPLYKHFIPDMVIPLGYRAGDDSQMDNKAVRKRNIEWLVPLHGGSTEFGKLVERDQVQVSQWLGGKPIGDKLARHVEAKLGKPVGWLDQPQWESRLNVQEAGSFYGPVSHLGRIDPDTFADTVHALLTVLRRRDKAARINVEDPDDVEMLCGAYNELMDLDDAADASGMLAGAVIADLIATREGRRNAKPGGKGTAPSQTGGADRKKAGKAGAGG